MTERQRPERNLALELVRVTESAALAAARWMGRGDKNGADGAAVAAMREVLHTVSMDGVVVIGEGEKDDAPMLYNGEQIGDGTPPAVDIAVSITDNLHAVAKAKGESVRDLTVVILDRERHEELISEVRAAGARVRL